MNINNTPSSVVLHIVKPEKSEQDSMFTERECKILELSKQGMKLHEIASAMSISLNTVKTYRARIRMKLKSQQINKASGF